MSRTLAKIFLVSIILGLSISYYVHVNYPEELSKGLVGITIDTLFITILILTFITNVRDTINHIKTRKG